MKTKPRYIASTLRKGFGFDVEQNFARATADTPCLIALDEYAKPRHFIAYIPANPASSLGFLRNGYTPYGLDRDDLRIGKVRIHALQDAFVTPIETPATVAP